MLLPTVAAVFVMCTGTLAGALVAVERAVVPMLLSLARQTWSEVHRLLDPGFDPLMPRVNKVALAAGLALALLAPGAAAKAAFAAALAGVVGVALVSELRNVRMNRRVDAWARAGEYPETWTELRSDWARANRTRTAFAVFAFLAALGGCALAWA
ncbi:anthrone oxygenase family protein [Streptomyces marokkonensis]|uniref:anthrone oxygenase family protein n=1 Tax=Streptomyces marokkonensis TaxID=324855 RepID=UPI0011F3BCE5|nr:anthrone oxygenase family protein [Streptomyces marokkonensis]